MLIRAATTEDLPAVAAIYAHEAATANSTFDSEPRSLEQWRAKLDSTEPGDHLLVAEEDGELVGHATSSSYRPRPAYRHTREVSVYLTGAAQGRGLGGALYDELLRLLVADRVHLVIAVVALPNDASRALHLRRGFESVGVLNEVGHKFGRWIDTEIFQLRLTTS